MKKLVTLLLLCSSIQVFGQLTLVKETDKDLEPFQLTNGDWMIFSNVYLNSTNGDKISSVNFFKSDLSLYKTVSISKNFPYDTVSFTTNNIEIHSVELLENNLEVPFTDKFFNNDDKIEFIVSYNSNKYENGKNIYRETSIILNEDGLELSRFSNPSGTVSFDYWKYLNVHLSNESQKPITHSTKLYSIPGNLPCPSSCSQKSATIAPISPANEFKEIQVNGFPNPSSDKVTLAYALPEGVSFGTLKLYTQTGELVKEFKVSSQVDHLELPVSDYTPGTYYYELQAGGNTSGGKKMVVIH